MLFTILYGKPLTRFKSVPPISFQPNWTRAHVDAWPLSQQEEEIYGGKKGGAAGSCL